SPSGSREGGFSLPMSSHGHSGAEPTKPPHSALTSENDNCNARPDGNNRWDIIFQIQVEERIIFARN
ncbi:MAG: hypothetical protein ACREFL_05845, partial [Stellaceae bacterium]